MRSVVRNFIILCAIIIFGSIAINNVSRTKSDIEITDVPNYTVDQKEDLLDDEEKLDIDEIEDNVDDIEAIDVEVSEETIDEEIENEEIDVELD
ncbi:hypothetical protein H9X78_15520, partial [Clostridium saudiense]|nr:hypothetical protein [Clostridium saudiense]